MCVLHVISLTGQERARQAKNNKMRPTAKSSTKVLDLKDEEEGVGVLDNLLEALHSGSALQPARSAL